MIPAYVTLAVMWTAQTGAPDAEVRVVEHRFAKAGWKTRRFETPLHVLVAVSSDHRLQYVFRFERCGPELRGFPTYDPNRTADHYVGGSDPVGAFFELLDWEETAPIVKELGLSVAQWESHARSITKYVHKPFKGGSQTLRRMTAQEEAEFLKALRAEEIVQRLITDEDGERVENLPFDTRIRRGYILGDVVWAELESKRDPLLVKYAVMVKCTPKGFRVVFSHANDVYGTPYDPAFLELSKIKAANKDLYAWWNYYAFEKEDFGASGKWLRTQLSKSSAFEAWSPDEMESTLQALKSKGPSFRGLVYAKKSGRAVVQFYNADGDLRFAELLNGELLRTRSLEEAVKHVESTNSSDVWWCYNGVSQQFGHPSLISALYQHRMKSGG